MENGGLNLMKNHDTSYYIIIITANQRQMTLTFLSIAVRFVMPLCGGVLMRGV